MKKYLSIVPIAMMLTACGTPSVEDLINDPETLMEISQKCQMLTMQGKDADTEECKNAKAAALQMTKNMMKGMNKDTMKMMNESFGQ